MASASRESELHDQESGSFKVKITILASEWGSSWGGLSTINRELAIQLAKSSSVEITFFVPQCSDEDKKEALRQNVHILKAKSLAAFEELEWLSFPPKDLEIHIIVGHGVKLGRQAQVIRNSHECKWVQVVHTDPEELGMFKSYPNPISAGEKKHSDEVELCNLADFVVGIGPKLTEAFRSYLCWCGREETIFDFTPGLFDEFMSVKQVPTERKHPTVLVFGRGDTEDFELKGFDIAARAVASLPDTHILFFGAPDGRLEEVKQRFLDCDVPAKRLKVRIYDKSRESLKRLFCEVDLVLMPSRTEGFGLAGLEALSAGLPVLVSQNSGFGEALSRVPFGSSFVIDSEDPEKWAAAIKKAWEKGGQSRLEEAEALRSSYDRKYSWTKQSDALRFKMINLVRARLRLKIDCEAIDGAGAPETATGRGGQELHSFVQDDSALLPITSNQVSSSSEVGNKSIPSRDEIFRKSLDMYLQAICPSKPEEFNGFLQYVTEARKLLIVDTQFGSLIITVEIRSLQILEELWEDYRTGHLNEMAERFLVPDDVLKEFGLSEVRLTTTIADEEYSACRDFFERPDRESRLEEIDALRSRMSELVDGGGNNSDDDTEYEEQLPQQLHEVQTEEQQHLSEEEGNKIRVYKHPPFLLPLTEEHDRIHPILYLPFNLWVPPIPANFFAYFRPSERIHTRDILHLICCPTFFRSQVKQELEKDGISPHEVYETCSKRPMIPGHDKAFVFVSGGISPVNEEYMGEVFLMLDTSGKYKKQLAIRLISDQQYCLVEFRSFAELQFRLPSRQMQGEASPGFRGKRRKIGSVRTATATRTSQNIKEGQPTDEELEMLANEIGEDWIPLISVKEGQPTDEELEMLASEIGEDWIPLGRRLKFGESPLIGFGKDKSKYSEKPYAMLLRWKQGGGTTNATYQILAEALCHELVGRTDLAEKYCC